MEATPEPYQKALDASPVDPNPEVPSWDNGTLYASALMVMRQEYGHNRSSLDLKKSTEARRAHKFAAMNLTDAAMNILGLSGDRTASVQLAVIEMRAMVANEGKKNIKVVEL